MGTLACRASASRRHDLLSSRNADFGLAEVCSHLPTAYARSEHTLPTAASLNTETFRRRAIAARCRPFDEVASPAILRARQLTFEQSREPASLAHRRRSHSPSSIARRASLSCRLLSTRLPVTTGQRLQIYRATGRATSREDHKLRPAFHRGSMLSRPTPRPRRRSAGKGRPGLLGRLGRPFNAGTSPKQLAIPTLG